MKGAMPKRPYTFREDGLFKESEPAESHVCEIQQKCCRSEIRPQGNRQGCRLTLRVENIFSAWLVAAVCLITDGPQCFGIRRIKVVFIGVRVGQNTRRPAA